MENKITFLIYFFIFFLGSTGSLNKEPIREEPAEKPKLPISEKHEKATEKAKNNKETPSTTKLEVTTEKSKELDLDSVLRSDNKLEHLTSERVKAPKRRPPSSQFQKDAVSFIFHFLA